jgi:hypothetical protein
MDRRSKFHDDPDVLAYWQLTAVPAAVELAERVEEPLSRCGLGVGFIVWLGVTPEVIIHAAKVGATRPDDRGSPRRTERQHVLALSVIGDAVQVERDVVELVSQRPGPSSSDRAVAC